MTRNKLVGVAFAGLLALGGGMGVACDEADDAGDEIEQEIDGGEGGEGEGGEGGEGEDD